MRRKFFLLLTALIVVVFVNIRLLSFETCVSVSMQPTALLGDVLLLWRGDWLLKRPLHRGDVIVFSVPHQKDFLKRVIGIPGDTVQLIGGRVYVNGVVLPRTPLVPQEHHLSMAWETIGGVQHQILEASDAEAHDNTVIYKVSPEHVFVLGDHRDDSKDSRLSPPGLVPFSSIKGRAVFRLWYVPLNSWPMRFDRGFAPLDRRIV